MSRGHIDAAAGGAFLSLTIDGAMALINKMVANQSWGEKENTKRNAYREGDRHAFRKNRFINEKTEEMGPRKRRHGRHHPGHGLAHDM